jgi:DNA-binding beta-propeller fold protein YncE
MPLAVRVSAIDSAGGKIFIGAGGENGMASDIYVFDSSSGEYVGSIHSDQLFFNLTATSDGARIYAPSITSHSIVVFDTKTMRQLKIIPNIGSTPGRVRIAP